MANTSRGAQTFAGGSIAMDFPIAEYMDEDACYAKIVAVLHPGGLVGPRCGIGDRLKVHRRHRAPVIDYRCDACGRVFNAFTGTEFHKARRRPSEILPILRGIAQGTSTAQLARELSRHRSSSYAHLKELGFGHATVCHVAHEW